MPGPIDLDPDTIRPPTDIARKVGERQDGSTIWQAGPDAKGYRPGQIVPNKYANTARKIRQNANLTKQILRYNDVTEKEAREIGGQLIGELDEAEGEEDRRDIWRRYVAS